MAEVVGGELNYDKSSLHHVIHANGSFSVSEFSSHGRTFRLAYAVTINVSISDELWTADCAAFGLTAFGRSRDEAVASLAEDFADYWDLIAEAEDAILAPDALQLKARLRASVVQTSHS